MAKMRTFAAVKGKGKVGDKAVTFEAPNKKEARRMLDENDMRDYTIVYDGDPARHRKLTNKDLKEVCRRVK